MSGTTSVPPLVIGPTGPIEPNELDVLNGVQTDVNAAFGNKLNISQLEVPQGQWASSLAACIADKNDQLTYLFSQVDPAFAEGRMQDGIARIYFIQRIPAQATVVQVLCTGLPGVAIPAGATLKANDDSIYAAVSGGTIENTGNVTLQFVNTVTGPITCQSGSVNKIISTIPGWDSVTNPMEGVPGRDVETRQEFEIRRYASVAINALGSVGSVLANVRQLDGVVDAYAVDNPTGAPVTINGVSVGAHTLYVAAVGGDDAALAQAIWRRKSVGCNTQGNTTVTVTDPIMDPAPSYTINFERPASTPVKVAVTITDSTDVPSDALLQIQGAVISAFTGADGGGRARIGSTIYASRFYAPIAALGAWARLVEVLIGVLSPPVLLTLNLPIDQAPTIAPTDISLTLV